MKVALFHSHYENEKLDSIKAEMQTLGSPEIRAIWSEMYGVWLAVEGCHRLRAAHALDIEPIIIDVSAEESITIQIDGDDEQVNVVELAEELSDSAHRTTILRF